ncbi:unnamed protein product, partial [Cuscuta europaea]
MDVLEEVVGGSKDLSHHIVKGKRTKRVKPHSPISFTMNNTTPTPYSSPGEEDNNNTASGASASGSGSATFRPDMPTADDEDMARCLMLLSRGGTSKEVEDNGGVYSNSNNSNNKFCSKKYVEATTVGGGVKVGMYVYECKTCGRTFPTFQALGGHRTSHTKEKPALTIEAAKRPAASALYDGGDEDFDPTPFNKTPKLSAFSSLQFHESTNKSSPRVHECSYCGAEFTSGQALGGHMRRHRGAAVTATTACSIDKRVFQKVNNDECLNLDLNLAPAGDNSKDRHRLGQEQPENQEQQAPPEKSTTFLTATTQLIG